MDKSYDHKSGFISPSFKFNSPVAEKNICIHCKQVTGVSIYEDKV